MTEYRVVFPEEQFQIVEFRQDDLPGVAVINQSLVAFEPKIVFAWHLSMMLHFEDLIQNGMPSRLERERVEPWEETIDQSFKGEHPEKPNALFLARITWNGTRELIYRIYDPEIVNQVLVRIIESKSQPRPFDYRMEHDPEWTQVKWHLDAVAAGLGSSLDVE